MQWGWVCTPTGTVSPQACLPTSLSPCTIPGLKDLPTEQLLQGGAISIFLLPEEYFGMPK